MRRAWVVGLSLVVALAGCVGPDPAAPDDIAALAAPSDTTLSGEGAGSFMIEIWGNETTLEWAFTARNTDRYDPAMGFVALDNGQGTRTHIFGGQASQPGIIITHGPVDETVRVPPSAKGSLELMHVSLSEFKDVLWSQPLLIAWSVGDKEGSLPYTLWINGTDHRLLEGPYFGSTRIHDDWSAQTHVSTNVDDSQPGPVAILSRSIAWTTTEDALIAYDAMQFGLQYVRHEKRTFQNGNETIAQEWTSDGTRLVVAGDEGAANAQGFMTVTREKAWRLDIERRVSTSPVSDVLLVGDVRLPDLYRPA